MSKSYPQFPNTVFPDAIQPLTLYEDITQQDVYNYLQAINAYMNGQLTSASNNLNSIANLDKKAITAEKMNTLLDTVAALQEYYQGGNFDEIVAGKQEEWEEILNHFEYKGVWSSSVTYVKNNMVSYTLTGDNTDQHRYLYICTADQIVGGSNPYTDFEENSTNPTWFRITIVGKNGDSGADSNTVSFTYEWNNTTTYQANDIAVYDNQWWLALQENVGVEPTEGSYWTSVMNINTVKQYPVQAEEPSNSAQEIGDLWFQVIE